MAPHTRKDRGDQIILSLQLSVEEEKGGVGECKVLGGDHKDVVEFKRN